MIVIKRAFDCKTALLAIICSLSVILCGCSDAVSSSVSDSAPDTSSVTSTAPQTTHATTLPQTTTTVTTVPVTEEPVQTELTTEQTEQPETQSSEYTDSAETEPQSEPPASQPETPSAPTDFEESFFDDALFIGDSITTGLYLYGYIDMSKVYAKMGLAPSTALYSDVDGVTLESKIKTDKPKKIYIMLGTNSVGYSDSAYLASCMEELVNSISSISKAKIYVLSIPPVTAYAEASYDNYLSKSAIDEYNRLLKTAISKTNAVFLDFHSVLTASDGYYYEEYHEMDGIHFMGSTYQVMLSFLEKHS